MSKVHQIHRVDEKMEALADRRRRRLLLDLLDHDPDRDAPVSIVDRSPDVDPVSHLVSMMHTHLPMLSVYEYIEWDPAHHEVRRGQAFEELRPLLELMREQETDRLLELP